MHDSRRVLNATELYTQKRSKGSFYVVYFITIKVYCNGVCHDSRLSNASCLLESRDHGFSPVYFQYFVDSRYSLKKGVEKLINVDVAHYFYIRLIPSSFTDEEPQRGVVTLLQSHS